MRGPIAWATALIGLALVGAGVTSAFFGWTNEEIPVPAASTLPAMRFEHRGGAPEPPGAPQRAVFDAWQAATRVLGLSSSGQDDLDVAFETAELPWPRAGRLVRASWVISGASCQVESGTWLWARPAGWALIVPVVPSYPGASRDLEKPVTTVYACDLRRAATAVSRRPRAFWWEPELVEDWRFERYLEDLRQGLDAACEDLAPSFNRAFGEAEDLQAAWRLAQARLDLAARGQRHFLWSVSSRLPDLPKGARRREPDTLPPVTWTPPRFDREGGAPRLRALVLRRDVWWRPDTLLEIDVRGGSKPSFHVVVRHGWEQFWPG